MCKGVTKQPTDITLKKPVKSSLTKCLASFGLLWLVSYCIYSTPQNWSSTERVVKETTWRLLWPFLSYINLYAALDILPDLDPAMVANEPPPKVIYVDNTKYSEEEITGIFESAFKKQDTVVVWKNFSIGTMDQWSDEEYIKEHLDLDKSYTFLRNFSNYLFVDLSVEEAFPHLEDLYLGFSYKLLTDNEDTLFKDLRNAINSKNKRFSSMIPTDFSVYHTFLYKGKKYSTGLHQAPVSDFFFQLANAKTWRFIHPRYTPYLKAVPGAQDISMTSAYDYLPDDSPIPYVDVTSGAGDLMYFPAHWWHQVVNEEDGIGIGVGFRPKKDFLNAFKMSLFPWTSYNKAVYTQRAQTVFHKILRKFNIFLNVRNKVSGLGVREDTVCVMHKEYNKRLPGAWSWNKLLTEKYGKLSTCEDYPEEIRNWKPEL